jgi:5-formyltetrahydrofolate cyclo-ligase
LSWVRREEALKKILIHFSSVSGVIASFSSLSEEIDLWPLNEQLAKEKRLALPRMNGDSLDFYLVDNPKEQLEISKWKLLEPIVEKCEKIPLDAIDTVLVPALAFDKANMRLGYGKGFYDRLLKDLKARKCGVGFTEQLSEVSLPLEAHDQPLDELHLF